MGLTRFTGHDAFQFRPISHNNIVPFLRVLIRSCVCAHHCVHLHTAMPTLAAFLIDLGSLFLELFKYFYKFYFMCINVCHVPGSHDSQKVALHLLELMLQIVVSLHKVDGS